jgi:YD repeat-containing protein
VSADPLYIEAGGLADPQQFNLYAYARNNPLRYTDPTGLDIRYSCDTEDNCSEALSMLNGRDNAQFKVEFDKSGKLKLVKGSKAKHLNKNESELLNAIEDSFNHATI